MRDGRVEQMGCPTELYERPASAFAAGFVGSPPMSLLPFEALRAAGAAGAPDGLPQGALLGLRPEAVRVVPSGAGRLCGSVQTLDYLGADAVLGVEVAGHRLVLRVPGYSAASLGAEVDLDWAAEAVHVFDGTTGARLASEPRSPAAAHARIDEPPAEGAHSRRQLGSGRRAAEPVQPKRITKGA
jgi:sn-glycerol 3-phosphate transport system ATP-binding protein